MFCPECGKQNEKSALFCAECGMRFEQLKKPSFINLEEITDITSITRTAAGLSAGILIKGIKKVKSIIIKHNKAFVFSICTVALVIGIILMAYIAANPDRVAKMFLNACASGDYSAVYDYLYLPDSELVTKDIFLEVMCNEKPFLKYEGKEIKFKRVNWYNNADEWVITYNAYNSENETEREQM